MEVKITISFTLQYLIVPTGMKRNSVRNLNIKILNQIPQISDFGFLLIFTFYQIKLININRSSSTNEHMIIYVRTSANNVCTISKFNTKRSKTLGHGKPPHALRNLSVCIFYCFIIN